MWFYEMLATRFGTRTAQIVLTIYYAVIVALVLTFALEPQGAFRYAQL